MNARISILLLLTLALYSCSTTERATQPGQSSAPDSVDFSTLLDPPKNWYHLDEDQSQFRGTSSQRAYRTLLDGRTPGRQVVVAVIDGGIDIDHEDLKEIIWTNSDEMPGNGMDDDQNGYVDDIHGWNFIGGPDGQNVSHDTFELTRIYKRLHERFGDADTTGLGPSEKQEFERYREIRTEYEQKVRELSTQFSNVRSLEQSMAQAKQILERQLGAQEYTYEEIQDISPQNQELQFARDVMLYVMENDIDSTLIAEEKERIYEFAKYGYNPDFSPRHIVGDNYNDKTERYYGNNDVAGPDPTHGTHVAGIVAAIRDNGIGINGMAANTRIMAIRAVPDGDERDKDVANAIRYAVDNGADVINMSFGKGYSPYKEVVDEAIRYADRHGVLMVHGAGNEARDTDKHASYPSPYYRESAGDSSVTLWLSVGATSWKPGKEFVASFSNYGERSVDLFAPGVDIYSTLPDNSYDFQDGTSMASPVVAGTAALLMAHFPGLPPAEIRSIILESTAKYPEQQVILPNEEGAEEPLVRFGTLSSSGGVVNLYQALKLAGERARSMPGTSSSGN